MATLRKLRSESHHNTASKESRFVTSYTRWITSFGGSRLEGIVGLRTKYYPLCTAIVGRGESAETFKFIAGSVIVELAHGEYAISQKPFPQAMYAPRY
jgi:hypothetical protein